MIIVGIMSHRIAIALLVAFLSSLAVSGQTPAPPAPKPIPPPPDVAAPPADAEKTATGLASKVITPASGGEAPKPTDLVTVHYTGWTTQGRMFDSSHARGKPNTFSLDRVFPGWRECVGLMRIGETRRCWIPQELAYKGQAGRPAGMLVFDVELLDVIGPPHDVAAPPPNAKRTSSGLAYRVLRPGTGARKPSPRGEVTVHYTGWTTDGKRFDSSVARGEPTTFGLDQVIPGWTEGVALMVEGEKTRFWIPQDLAYKGQAGSPRGMLVFDIELLRIEK
jgi:FKBP-type peptidyl-prolyl cis-trans isomerase